MKIVSNTRLTSMEIASLWNGYMLVSLVHHVFQCFLDMLMIKTSTRILK